MLATLRDRLRALPTFLVSRRDKAAMLRAQVGGCDSMRIPIWSFPAAIALATVAAPATATQFTYVFDTHTTNGSQSVDPQLVSQTSQAPNPGLAIVGVSAWTAVRSGSTVNINQSNLTITDGGFGIVSNANDNYTACGGAGRCGMDQIDNVGNAAGRTAYDFVQLVFSRAVTLTGMSRMAFAQYGNVFDDDASYGHGATQADISLHNTSWPTPLAGNAGNNAIASRSADQFNLMLETTLVSGDSNPLNSIGDGCSPNHTFNGEGFCSDSNIWATASAGNVVSDAYTASTVWWIGAAIANPDSKTDAFKLYDFRVVYNDTPDAVPEPATWAMMLLGFGIVAGAARLRVRNVTASSA